MKRLKTGFKHFLKNMSSDLKGLLPEENDATSLGKAETKQEEDLPEEISEEINRELSRVDEEKREVDSWREELNVLLDRKRDCNYFYEEFCEKHKQRMEQLSEEASSVMKRGAAEGEGPIDSNHLDESEKDEESIVEDAPLVKATTTTHCPEPSIDSSHLDETEKDEVSIAEDVVAPEVAAPTPGLEPEFNYDSASYNMPDIGDLKHMDPESLKFVDEGVLEDQKLKLQMTLDNFSVDALVIDAIIGPRVTQFRVRPGVGVRVESITSLENNIAMSLAAESVRIQAPIPGEPFVGIEVPNHNPISLTLGTLMEASTWKENKDDIPIILGMDLSGKVIVTDLAKAPHMLIAGATGSGKSVCINNIILSLIYRFHPDDLELALVDPKQVEFSMYKKVPHLIHSVVTDTKKVVQLLKWIVREMEERYEMMAEKKVRNIAGYNEKAKAQGFAKMPFMVLIIDEMADLMITSKGDIEGSVARIAQLARASGIHTILATQRPSVNVITGTIKANYPTRIAFQVSSQIDARTIMDVKGAESLLGKGDMLFNPPGISQLMRLQGPMVEDDEIERIIESLAAQRPPKFRIDLSQIDEEEEGSSTIQDERLKGKDPQLTKALEVIVSSQRASTSYLQRRMRIGYNKAATLMEELEDLGFVGPQIGSTPREILMSVEQL